MKNSQFRSMYILTILFVLLVPSVHALGASLEARYGVAYSKYLQQEGEGAYDEDAKWMIATVRGEVALVPAIRLVGEAQFGRTTEVAVKFGADAVDLSGQLNRQLVGAELVWQPTHLFTFGGGLAYLRDGQTFGWEAKHPGGDGTPPFDPNDTLSWDWERSVTGLLALASVDFDAGLVQVTGRVGYAPSTKWTETTKATLGDSWEEWNPSTMDGSAGLYELSAQLRLWSGFSVVGGVQGVIMQSPKIPQLSVDYTNSDGASGETVTWNVPSVVDNAHSFYAGLHYRF